MRDPTATPRAPQPGKTTSRRRVCLLVLLLAALLTLLWARPDLRRPAIAYTRSGADYLLFDVVGLSPRTVYLWRLRLAGLYDRPMGRDWRHAVARAQTHATNFHRRLAIRLDFADDTIAARVLTTQLARGEALRWRLVRDHSGSGQLFASLEYRPSESTSWRHLAALAADGAAHRLVASDDGHYRLILQPALSARVHARLAVARGGSLPFPVVGGHGYDIGGGFGAPRADGSRRHQGVDIFADRDTPVRAVVDGRVTTGHGGLGGHYIFLSSGLTGPRFYYAHLDHFAVDNGAYVDTGDVIGYVGNSGNAAGGPTHLHFGVYHAGGAIDPAPFIRAMPDLPDLPTPAAGPG